MKLVLLPGLDGTGLLFDPLLRILPSHFSSIVISYPPDEPLGYAELVPYVKSRIPANEDFVIVAESFSGPLAVDIAASHPPHLKGLILCATFVSNPSLVPGQLSWLVRNPVLVLASRPFLLAHYLTGTDSPASFIENFHKCLHSVSPNVLAYRMRAVMNVNKREELWKCDVPILYLVAQQDRFVKRRSLTEMKSIKATMEVTAIDGPHLLLQRKPEECLEAMNRFISHCA
jgi:pimeloyl-[acyl-carrier protein] methyl ester esterase